MEEGALQIICMTPWALNDLAAKIQSVEAERCYLLSMPALKDGEMLCPELLSRESYDSKKAIADEAIFAANYDMIRLDIKGCLYSGFQTYTQIPENRKGNIAYTDTADEGADYLCSIHAVQSGEFLFVTDVLYTQEPQEKTELELCDMIAENSTREIQIESNNGGRAFARNIQRILQERHYACSVRWFHQSENKQSRILTNAPVVQKYILFPEGWPLRWPSFYAALTRYQKEGKNKHDDAPDALTGLFSKFGCGANKISIPSGNIRARARI
jgi:predicted phage terminase large subunit-like protein